MTIIKAHYNRGQMTLIPSLYILEPIKENSYRHKGNENKRY